MNVDFNWILIVCRSCGKISSIQLWLINSSFDMRLQNLFGLCQLKTISNSSCRLICNREINGDILRARIVRVWELFDIENLMAMIVIFWIYCLFGVWWNYLDSFVTDLIRSVGKYWTFGSCFCSEMSKFCFFCSE